MFITDMSSGEIDSEFHSSEAGYATEVLCANWNPVMAQLAEVSSEPLQNLLPAHLAQVDAESFLARMYKNQES